MQEKIEHAFSDVKEAANIDEIPDQNSELGTKIEEFLDYILVAILQDEL